MSLVTIWYNIRQMSTPMKNKNTNRTIGFDTNELNLVRLVIIFQYISLSLFTVDIISIISVPVCRTILFSVKKVRKMNRNLWNRKKISDHDRKLQMLFLFKINCILHKLLWKIWNFVFSVLQVIFLYWRESVW